MTAGSEWEIVDDQGLGACRQEQLEGLSLSGGRGVMRRAEEGCSGSQCGHRKTLTAPLGLPRRPLGCREGVLGTELGLDRMRQSHYSELSGSLVIAGQGYREDRGQVRRKESGKSKPEAFWGAENKV